MKEYHADTEILAEIQKLSAERSRIASERRTRENEAQKELDDFLEKNSLDHRSTTEAISKVLSSLTPNLRDIIPEYRFCLEPQKIEIGGCRHKLHFSPFYLAHGPTHPRFEFVIREPTEMLTRDEIRERIRAAASVVLASTKMLAVRPAKLVNAELPIRRATAKQLHLLDKEIRWTFLRSRAPAKIYKGAYKTGSRVGIPIFYNADSNRFFMGAGGKVSLGDWTPADGYEPSDDAKQLLKYHAASRKLGYLFLQLGSAVLTPKFKIEKNEAAQAFDYVGAIGAWKYVWKEHGPFLRYTVIDDIAIFYSTYDQYYRLYRVTAKEYLGLYKVWRSDRFSLWSQLGEPLGTTGVLLKRTADGRPRITNGLESVSHSSGELVASEVQRALLNYEE